ncbi:YdcF family protein [Psychrobacillus sp. FJAT-51614]|uniref:YdcF family protein n=1 Tax=Psychrobacillus mangrovi TaxID=3117745 RepID=A0ABU8F776_9BACI
MSYPFECFTNFIFVETEIVPADVILIPGSSHPQLMEQATFLYHQGLAPFILPSGGANPRVETTEWDFLKDVGVENGVPKEAILKENRAQNTFQNARFSLEVLHKTGIQPKKVIMVCMAVHSRRALLTYQTVFPKETEFFISPVIDRTGITKENWFLTDEGICHVMAEVEKIGKYFRNHIANWVK